MSATRGVIVAALFIALVLVLIACIVHGRRLIRNERTDAVFGNPARAMGGWHWVVAGVSSVLLIWLFFSWDAARAFFPDAANELCQVAKVDSAISPMRAVFPFEARQLRGTEILHRELGTLQRLQRMLTRGDMSPAERESLGPLIDRALEALYSRADPGQVSAKVSAGMQEIGARIDVVTERLKAGELPDGADQALLAARDSQAGWGTSSTEIPVKPVTTRGALFDQAAGPLREISREFSGLRNTDPAFEELVDALEADIGAAETTSDSGRALQRELGKTLKRIDDGTVYPPGSLAYVEAAMTRYDAVAHQRQGSLAWIDRIAMPGGSVKAGNNACSEQGSGRWLPKPSDTVATLVRISDPAIGYKGVPMLWFHQKPLAEMVGFILPDFIADLVPGGYPRHGVDGIVEPNLKTRVLDIATGSFDSPSVPVPMGHVWDSILRVVTGLFLGIVLGVPLGLFMGLSRFAKGFFDPLIELYRPVPPLAWAPLILTIFGIGDNGKVFLLFMVAFAIMVISARTGATGTQLSKIHAAHSLGASRWQIVRNVILPNSLPEILTGIRIAIGVCWGTLVAAEILAGTTGIGFVENVARKQSDYEIIWVTIIILGVLGLLFDIVMRFVINRTIPWRGKG